MRSHNVEDGAALSKAGVLGRLFACLCVATALLAVPVPGEAAWVTGYYVGYQRDLYPPSVVKYDAMTHLTVGRVVPLTNGTLDTSFDIDPVSGPAMADDLVTRAHAVGTKTILMVGGDGAHDGFAGAASAANRTTFINNLVTFAQAHGFDGLDLDWEPFPAADKAPFTALIQGLKTRWPGVILTVPVGYQNINIPDDLSYYPTIAPLVDQINIMSYVMNLDCCGWDTWHTSALYGETGTTPTSISSTVNLYLAAGVPANKLGIGIGFFGTCFSPPATGPKQPLNGSVLRASDNVMSYTNIMTKYYTAAAARWDASAREAYLSFSSATGPQGCGFISYDDPQSIAERGAYVNAEGLGGTIIWTINQGYLPANPAGQRDPLMTAIGTAFLGQRYMLTLTKSGLGTGTVTSTPTGISCGSDCSENYAQGTAVTLQATAATGATFTGWGGACSGAATSCQVTVNAATNVTATFSLGSTFAIGEASVTEGNAGTKTISVQVTRSGDTTGTATVQFGTADGTATPVSPADGAAPTTDAVKGPRTQ